MKYLKIILLSVSLLYFTYNSLYSQNRDKGKFIEYKNEFWDEIEDSIKDFNKKEKPKKLTFKMDFSGYELPKSKEEFISYWHNEPLSQGKTGTCWCFSTTSFLESEVYRIQNKKLKLSQMFTVYWEYVEKARRYVRERGNSEFSEGSQANAVLRIWKNYGCVPAESYTGLKPNQKFHDHSVMYDEMMNYLENIKKINAWNEEQVITTIRSILGHYLGEPPEFVIIEGKKITPKEYLQTIVKLNPDDYIDILSILEQPYFKKCIYDVPDNWWKNSDYNNVPLDDFMSFLKKSIKSGYTAFIGGDVSEAGIDSHSEVAVVPTFDIPSEYIDENARQFRFSNKTTTDDHGVHIVGYKESKDGKYWFLIKDSGSGSFNGTNKGYYFYHEDYIKLKMMNFLIHRSAVEELIKKIAIN